MQSESKRLLTEAADEIRSLRRKNELQAARLGMFDSVMLLFTTEPNFPREGFSEDVVWKIEKHLEAQKQPEPVKANE